MATIDEKKVKSHEYYGAAKSGNAIAAALLVREFCSGDYLAKLYRMFDFAPRMRVAAVHAEEEFGRNQIAQALAVFIAGHLGAEIDDNVVQVNIVNHTGATGYKRLALQALFEGEVEKGRDYLLVDDFIGQGGTLANFRGHVDVLGGRVVGATVVTGKSFSAKIALSEHTLDELRMKHGAALEHWWQEQFGFGFECLTESEARYLSRSADVESIRDRILAERQT